jgi:hypothetical protein
LQNESLSQGLRQYWILVEEKSVMFRLLDEEEYANGLAQLKADIGKQFYDSGRGESLIWLKKQPIL